MRIIRLLVLLIVLVACGGGTPEPTPDYVIDLANLSMEILLSSLMSADVINNAETSDDVLETCQESKLLFEGLQTEIDEMDVPMELIATKSYLSSSVDLFLRSFSSCIAGDTTQAMDEYFVNALRELSLAEKNIEALLDE